MLPSATPLTGPSPGTSRPRRIPGPIEKAARGDVRRMPAEFHSCAVAAAYVMLARRLDAGMSPRDAGPVSREMRMTLLTLHEMAPPKREGDYVDEVRVQREKRLAALTAE